MTSIFCRYEQCYDQLRGEDDSLRLEMENLKGELTSLRADQEAKESTFNITEASLRSDVINGPKFMDTFTVTSRDNWPASGLTGGQRPHI
jgi:hypothetical protein